MPCTRIAVGLVWRDDHVVVGRRGEDQVLPGREEFPGGKCEDGEAPETAVVREVGEETGLDVQVRGLRDVVRHEYGHGEVELYFFDCDPTEETSHWPVLKAPFEWRQTRSLDCGCFPEANRRVIDSILRWDGEHR